MRLAQCDTRHGVLIIQFDGLIGHPETITKMATYLQISDTGGLKVMNLGRGRVCDGKREV